ncbi:hypothetical protein QTP88_005925 [Uroleucon formosanum]
MTIYLIFLWLACLYENDNNISILITNLHGQGFIVKLSVVYENINTTILFRAFGHSSKMSETRSKDNNITLHQIR